jgi:hypothetical protein
MIGKTAPRVLTVGVSALIFHAGQDFARRARKNRLP